MNERGSLDQVQIEDITRWLGKSHETEQFIESVKYLLAIFAHDWHSQGQDLRKKKYARLKQIRTLAQNLQEFLSTKPLSPGEITDEASLDKWIMTDLKNFAYFEDKPIFDPDKAIEKFADAGETLAGICEAIDSVFSDGIQRHVPKTKPKNVDLEDFSNDLVRRFHSTMNRLPVISETSRDLNALEVIYNAYGYHASDLAKVIKRACKAHRDILKAMSEGQN